MHVSKSVTRATWHKPCSASPHSRNPRQLEATRPSTGPAKHFTGQGLTITLSPSDARTQMSSTDSFLLDQSLFVLCRSFQRWGYKGEPECCSAILISKQGFWSSSIYLSPNHCLKYGVHPPGLEGLVLSVPSHVASRVEAPVRPGTGAGRQGGIAVSSTALSWS